ncbi:hypothetical protein ACK3TF_000436 [Chlorella vulgaris]
MVSITECRQFTSEQSSAGACHAPEPQPKASAACAAAAAASIYYLLRKKGIFSSLLSLFCLSLRSGKLLLKLVATQPQLLPVCLGLAQLLCHCRSLCSCRLPVLLLQLRRLRL